MAVYDDDIKRIEVGLSFLNGQDTTAAVEFAKSLKAATDFFSKFDPKSITDAFTTAISKIESQRQGQAHAQGMQTGGSYVSPPQYSAPPLSSYNQQLGDLQMSLADLLGQQTIPGMDNIGAGSFIGSPTSPTVTAQQAQQKMSMGARYTSFINAQNQKLGNLPFLGHGGSLFGAGGQGVSDTSDVAMATTPGAATADFLKTYGSEVAKGAVVGQIYGMGQRLIHAPGSMISNIASMANPYSAQMTGAQLGYQRGGGFMGLPFASPFSSATSEGYRQQLDALKLAFSPGINLGQAQMIEQASAGYGFSGAMGSQVTDQLLAPLFQKFGMNPQQVLQNFGAGLRTGIQTVTQLRGSLEGLGQAAQAASMTLADTSNAVASANQAVQSIGGTPQTGIAFGSQFQSITGLPANVGGQLVTNPFVQSMIALDTGVMPSLQGTLSATTLNGGITQSVAMLSKLFGNSFAPKTQTMYSPTGQRLYTQTESSSQLGDAMIANYLGLDVGQVQRLQKFAGPDSWGYSLQGEAKKYASQVGPAAHIQNSTIQNLINRYGVNKGYEMPSGVHGAGKVGFTTLSHNLPAGTQVISSNSTKDTFTVRLPDGSTQDLPMSSLNLGSGYQSGGGTAGTLIQSELAAMQHASGAAGGSQVYWNQIEKQIGESGIWKGKGQKEIQKLNKIADPRTRANLLNNDISHQMSNAYKGLGNGGTTIQIALTGQAKKMFTANPTSVTIQANSGTGPTLNYQAATPQGLSPLTTYTPYDSGDYESN